MGVLYSDEGGPSGAGAGVIRLAANDRIYEINYQKPFSRQFSKPNCSEPGAIWSVNVTGPESNLRLLSADCRGQVDSATHNAWLLVKRFLSRLQQNAASALDLIPANWRRSEQFKGIEEKIKSLQLEEYSKFGGEGHCLEIVSPPGSNSIEIEAGDDCSLTIAGKPASARFKVSRSKEGKEPVIDAIQFE